MRIHFGQETIKVMNHGYYHLDDAHERINIFVLIWESGKCGVGLVDLLLSFGENVLLVSIRILGLSFCNNLRAIAGRI